MAETGTRNPLKTPGLVDITGSSFSVVNHGPRVLTRSHKAGAAGGLVSVARTLRWIG